MGVAITDKFTNLSISNNNIYANNGSIALSSYASKDVNASNNWWGTTSEFEIEKSIHDYNDDFNFGRVNYLPILVEPVQSAPDPNSPIPEAIITDLPSPENQTSAFETGPLNQSSQNEATLISQPSPESMLISLEGFVLIIGISMAVVLLIVYSYLQKNKEKRKEREDS